MPSCLRIRALTKPLLRVHRASSHLAPVLTTESPSTATLMPGYLFWLMGSFSSPLGLLGIAPLSKILINDALVKKNRFSYTRHKYTPIRYHQIEQITSPPSPISSHPSFMIHLDVDMMERPSGGLPISLFLRYMRLAACSPSEGLRR